MAKINFFRGLREKYNATTHADALFFATDSQEIILNNKAYGMDVEGQSALNAAIAAVEAKANTNAGSISTINTKLGTIAEGAQVNVIESVKVDGTALEISDKSVNIAIAAPIATAKAEAISAGAVTMSESAGTGNILKTYTFSQNGAEIGKINIAKDLVVTGGEIVEESGVKYLSLSIANQEVPVKIAVTDLVDVYTAGAYISISDSNEVSVKFSELDAALIAESAQVGAAIKANADAVIAEQNRAKGIEDALRADLGTKAEGASDAFTRISALEAAIGNNEEGDSLASRVTAAESAIDAIEADYLKAADKEALQSSINGVSAVANAAATKDALAEEAETARAAEEANANAISAIQKDYLKAADKAELSGATAQALVDAKAYTDSAKQATDAYTVNSIAISSNPVLTGSNIKLTGYTAGDGSAIAATDSINDAIAKLEYNLTWHEA